MIWSTCTRGQGRTAHRRYLHQFRSRYRGDDHRSAAQHADEHSTTLSALRYVILDEVHYLADRFRGPVWEEVIIHLPQRVRIVALSATVSNVEDFGDWISSVRGDTKLIVSEKRPVPLEQHVMLQQSDRTEPEIIDLYRRDRNDRQTSEVNTELARRLSQLDHQASRRRSEERSGKFKRRDTPGGKGRGGAPSHKAERHTPRRWAVVDELNYLDMLPGIYFIFSRNGCDQAVEQCLNAGLELTTDEEAKRIRAIVDEMVEGQLSHDDLKTLGFSRCTISFHGSEIIFKGIAILIQRILQRTPVHLVGYGFIVPPREFRNEHRLVPILLGLGNSGLLVSIYLSTITQQHLRFINSVRFRQINSTEYSSCLRRRYGYRNRVCLYSKFFRASTTSCEGA